MEKDSTIYPIISPLLVRNWVVNSITFLKKKTSNVSVSGIYLELQKQMEE
jgi:hypothetical protein